MSGYIGDFIEGATIRTAFTTNAATGARESMSASLEEADITVYKDNNTTALTLTAATITISANPGSQVGVYLVSFDMSNDADFTPGSDYIAIVYPSDETIDSVAPARVIAHWSCENRPPPGVITGTFSGTPTTAAGNTDLTAYAADELIDGVLIVVSGTGVGQRKLITDYVVTNGVITYNTMATAPVSGDRFIIV